MKILAAAKGTPSTVPVYNKQKKTTEYREVGYDPPNVVIKTSDTEVRIWKVE